MKKLLTLIGAITLTTTGAITLVSCGGGTGTAENGEKETPIEMDFKTLLTKKVSEIYTGKVVGYANDESENMPIDTVKISELIQGFWDEDNNKFYEGFMTGTVEYTTDDVAYKYVFSLVAKEGHKDKTKMILNSIIDADNNIVQKQ